MSSACAALLFLPLVADSATTEPDLQIAVTASADELRAAVVAAIPSQWGPDPVSSPEVSRLGEHGWRITIRWIEHDDEWIFPDSATPWQMSFHVTPLDANRSCLLAVPDNQPRLWESGFEIARKVRSELETRLRHDPAAERDCRTLFRTERERRAAGVPAEITPQAVRG